MRSDLKRKLFAITAIALMLSVSVIPMLSVQDSDAASGDGGTYSYTIAYDSSLMSSTSAAISVDDMDAIYHPSYDGTTTTGYGDWTWDMKTGLGPFNSFYAAFDMTDGNKFVAVLNPFNLMETVRGEDISSHTSEYNIMWVLPTVYWYTDSSGNLTLTNDSTAGGTAYAHTIDGHVYSYIAYGVYEASRTTVDGSTVLTSTSGSSPATNIARPTARTYAHNYSMDSSLATDSSNPAYSMLWNLYQWELYKYCALTLMENFNSQSVVGNGPVYNTVTTDNTYGHTSTYIWTTGYTDALGPYTGNTGSINGATFFATNGETPVKLFLENAWGGCRETVDGNVVACSSSDLTIYVDTSSTPSDSTSGTYIDSMTLAYSSDGFPTQISTDPSSWGWGIGGVGGSNNGLADYKYGSTSGTMFIGGVGGMAHSYYGNAYQMGLNYARYTYSLNGSPGADVCNRITFVFDQDLTQYIVTWDVDGTETEESYVYGETPVYPGTPTKQYYTFVDWTPSIAAVTGDATYTATWTPTIYTVTFDANGGTVSPEYTYGSAESPATLPKPTRSEYDFTGWYTDPDDGTRITSPYYPTEDLTLYAHWETALELQLSDLFFPLVITVLIFTMMLMLYRSGELTATQLVTATIGSAAALLIMFQFLFPVL